MEQKLFERKLYFSLITKRPWQYVIVYQLPSPQPFAFENEIR